MPRFRKYVSAGVRVIGCAIAKSRRAASGDPVGLLAERGARSPGAYRSGDVSARAWSRDSFDYAIAGAVPDARLAALAAELAGPR